MCGIVGYVGFREAKEVLLDKLARIEYRGHDGAGIAIRTVTGIEVYKKGGPLAGLVRELKLRSVRGMLGLGHTRWATHGVPDDRNAHPHASEDGSIVVVHNGIIENYHPLKERLAAQGHAFRSETDSEVLAHIIAEKYRGDLAGAVRAALMEVRGAYAVVVAHAEHEEIVAARGVSPLVIGIGDGEMFLASDVLALLPYTRRVVFLQDGDLVAVRSQSYDVTDLGGKPRARAPTLIEWSDEAAEKGDWDTFMLKEIHEQPRALAKTIAGGLRGSVGEAWLDLRLDPSSIDRVQIIGCGTAYHAGLVGEHLIERLARLQVEVDIASEYRYRQPIVDERTLVIAISQSGETMDTLEALREAKRLGARTLGIINVQGSSMTREAHEVLYVHAGPEIGVASTKTYTAQLSALLLLAIWLGRARRVLSPGRAAQLSAELRDLPRVVGEALDAARVAEIARIAARYRDARGWLFLGRGVNVPSALEGALKLKELSYVYAEAHAAGEMKHGPISIIDDGLPVVVIATECSLLEKVLSNIQEVRARSGRVIALVSDGDTEAARHADDLIRVPRTDELLSPVVNAVSLQLLAYHVASLLGRDVDKPRNLAKSVTVE
ncbi:glutamine--fructose-6-phosphate transaminase (isomerizing) [Sorangium sp. So ce1182]|uniref:glutamine--fructose-6-phosphate transaminase (isomerizing) n=1 Tax=Sorangium sp. So ce1182 TaxID=3133334 RepID=UPI003F61D2AD